jgi:hypothetical protein
VPTLTLGALLRPEARRRLTPELTYWFCSAPDCETVYYAKDRTFAVQDIAVPVWQKQPTAETPVCYCFGWTLATIQRVPEKQAVLQDITKQVQSGNCYCEVTNPQGACCLGNVAEVIKNAWSPTERGERR